jgi:hypothetical protein
VIPTKKIALQKTQLYQGKVAKLLSIIRYLAEYRTQQQIVL